MLILDAFNLTSLYFRHPRTLYFIHIPIVTGPLAWNFVAVLWNGAAMVGAQGLAARIIANIAIWSILLYGTFFMAAFKDHSMGFELTILTACTCYPHRLLRRRTVLIVVSVSACCASVSCRSRRSAMGLGYGDRSSAPNGRPCHHGSAHLGQGIGMEKIRR